MLVYSMYGSVYSVVLTGCMVGPRSAKVAGHFRELTKNSACSKNGSRAFSCSSSAWRMREALSRYSWADSSRGDTR